MKLLLALIFGLVFWLAFLQANEANPDSIRMRPFVTGSLQKANKGNMDVIMDIVREDVDNVQATLNTFGIATNVQIDDTIISSGEEMKKWIVPGSCRR